MESAEHHDYFILDEHDEPLAVDLMTWAVWREEHRARLRVAWWEAVNPRQPDCPIHVSTVFLGINHRFFGDGPPLLFETMIFAAGYELDQDQERASTITQARAIHGEAVECVIAILLAEREHATTQP
jgi:hypothetical protein